MTKTQTHNAPGEAMQFEINGKHYRTDSQTLRVLREQVARFRARGNSDVSAITAIMALGLATAAIVEIVR